MLFGLSWLNICTGEDMKEHGTWVKVRRRQISLTHFVKNKETKPDAKIRSSCKGWNQGIANRIGAYISNYREDFTVIGTLTYGTDYPKDGVIVKAHWRAFIERLRRTGWLESGSLVWFLEFQQRGAPHFHFLGTEFIGKDWVSKNWAEITRGNMKSCSSVEAIRKPEAMGWYARKYAMKSEQKEVPQEFKNIGRMWGCSGPRIKHGLPRVPTLHAKIVNAIPSDLADSVGRCRKIAGLKVVTTDSGYVLFGSEQDISVGWKILRGELAYITLKMEHYLGWNKIRHGTG